MLAVMLAGVMFPLWPPIMRLGVWYLSIGVLGLIGLFIIIAIIRLIFYIITIIFVPPGIWIFPKLFADVGFVSIFETCLYVELRPHRCLVFRSSRSFHYGSGIYPRRRASGARRRQRRRARARERTERAQVWRLPKLVPPLRTRVARAHRAEERQ